MRNSFNEIFNVQNVHDTQHLILQEFDTKLVFSFYEILDGPKNIIVEQCAINKYW